jgi:amino acid transporter
MCCYDAPAHMTEEIKNARKEAPRAIVLAVYMGFITGFAWLIALSFCIATLTLRLRLRLVFQSSKLSSILLAASLEPRLSYP